MPRTRGDGPTSNFPSVGNSSVAPHTRGWAPICRQVFIGEGGCPAHAGMGRTARLPVQCNGGLPRTRGDGPPLQQQLRPAPWVAPHTRGWAQLKPTPPRGGIGCPAHAGMGPSGDSPGFRPGRLPRTRGDGPQRRTHAVPPRQVAPHTRGWALPEPSPRCVRRGCPAHAGMGPRLGTGMTSQRRLPRTRGDGPLSTATSLGSAWVAPHTRGWARRRARQRHGRDGCPAHAGMGPTASKHRNALRRLPRTRGDGPQEEAIEACVKLVAPHTRGWALRLPDDSATHVGCPAHAGMGPRPGPSLSSKLGCPAHAGIGPACAWKWRFIQRLPRTRGDRPNTPKHYSRAPAVAPHTRG